MLPALLEMLDQQEPLDHQVHQELLVLQVLPAQQGRQVLQVQMLQRCLIY